MMRASRRKRAAWGDLIVGLLILAAAVGLAVSLTGKDAEPVTAQVTVGGQILLSCRLGDLEEPLLFPVEGEHRLKLELSPEGVRVLETQCPGEDCLLMGMITRTGERIVCLPNRMVVSLQGDGADYDAVIG